MSLLFKGYLQILYHKSFVSGILGEQLVIISCREGEKDKRHIGGRTAKFYQVSASFEATMKSNCQIKKGKL